MEIQQITRREFIEIYGEPMEDISTRKPNARYSNQLEASYYSPSRLMKKADRKAHFKGLRLDRKMRWGALQLNGQILPERKTWEQLRTTPRSS